MANSPFLLTNRDVWVVGGAGYLGTATVKLLVMQGARVACIDIGEKAKEMVEREKLTDAVTPISFDASDGEKTRQFFQDLLHTRGTPEGLVLMTYKSSGKKMDDLLCEDFDAANRVGLTATFAVAREVGNAMAEKKRGSIVLFSSMYGTVAPDPNMYPAPLNPNPIEYGVGKAGIQQMARYLAVHWAPNNVRCNAISPGPFPFVSQQEKYPEWMSRIRSHCPMGRVGEPSEIAGVVVFLLSDASSYVTGHNLAVDGGWTAW